MSAEEPIAPAPPNRPASGFPWGIVFVFAIVLMSGAIAFLLMNKPFPPAPPEVARDPLLSQGRTIYLTRCIACHGIEGKGNGPLARNLTGPPPGNLTDAEWKHGDQPAKVMQVIAEGVPRTRMDGWGQVLDPSGIRAVSAYVYYLAGRAVPEALRAP